MVIWIIGLSGAGKTTIANHVVDRIRKNGSKVVLLDGDLIRDLFKNDVDHTVEGRRHNAERLSMLSRYLDKQGVHVVAAVLSIFPDWQDWNRKNMTAYCEVYLKTSMEVLRRRDTKNLYASADNGEIKNVVGVDIPFPEPKNPDLIIENDAERKEFSKIIDSIMNLSVVEKGLSD